MAKKEKAAPKAEVKKAAPKKVAAPKVAAPKAAVKKVAAPKAEVKKAAPKPVVKLDPKKPLTKAQIVEHMATKLEVTKKQSALFLDELALLAGKNAKKGFTIPGIGKVTTAVRKARKGRNPQTGAEIKIAKKNVVKLKVGKALQDSVFPPKVEK
ncbi:MAG: histidyl-tRNA synthetase [Ignavibacteriales bacterium CG18_big_fil_WC_8_21_14_2_50_31_20]|nr:MAG: histidyl-tRNA synthetase [Ignavibacteriales bacterium CG18_big_fil_WC_8_21_14_2_50_31_20]